MPRTLILAVVLGLSVSVAKPSDDSQFVADSPVRRDFRLAQPAGVHAKKIGVLMYYPNKAGGYTFLQHGDIVFYALPYLPSTREVENTTLPTIGASKVPFGGQVIYRSQMNGFGIERRADIPIAKWTRDTPDGPFRFTMRDEDRLSRLKLQSIVPVLENASKNLVSRP
jgi:hypothetical protein